MLYGSKSAKVFSNSKIKTKKQTHKPNMFEARLVQGSLFKKIVEAIRELVVDANLDCNEAGITLQVK